MVWIVMDRLNATGREVLVASGEKGTDQWLEPVSLEKPSTPCFQSPRSAFSSLGDLIVTCRGATTVNNSVYSYVRSGVSGKWSPLLALLKTTDVFRNVEVIATPDGRFAHVLDPMVAGKTTVRSLFYDPRTNSITVPEQLSPNNLPVVAPTFLANKDQTALYLAYAVTEGSAATRGIYIHSYDRYAHRWSPARWIRGSGNIQLTSVGPATKLVGAVDHHGYLTLVWEGNAVGGGFSVFSSRVPTDGACTTSQLTAPSPVRFADLETFASLTPNDRGDLMLAMSRYERNQSHVITVRFYWGFGWGTPQVAATSPMNLLGRTRVTFLPSGHGLLTFLGMQDGIRQITSLASENDQWSANLLDIPDRYDGWMQQLETIGDKALLVFTASKDEHEGGVVATWFKP